MGADLTAAGALGQVFCTLCVHKGKASPRFKAIRQQKGDWHINCVQISRQVQDVARSRAVAALQVFAARSLSPPAPPSNVVAEGANPLNIR
jgi:hypothetical protein